MSFMISADNKSKYRNGYCVSYENGYEVSVQFGYGNYCDNYDSYGGNSNTAECAVLVGGEFVRVDDTWSDDVKGYMTAEEVTDLMYQVKNIKGE